MPQSAIENALLNEKLIGAFLSRYPFPNGVVEEEIPPATPVLSWVKTQRKTDAAAIRKAFEFRGKNPNVKFEQSLTNGFA